MSQPQITPPEGGARITIAGGQLQVPDNPIIPFIEGDGTGPDIWAAAVRVLDAAVENAYAGARKIRCVEIYAGQKPFDEWGTWLPDTTVEAIERCSGHDGTYAVKQEYHEISMKIARPVVNKVKQAESDHYTSDCAMAGSAKSGSP